MPAKGLSVSPKSATPFTRTEIIKHGKQNDNCNARPKLPRGVRLVHNEAQGGWVLLAPERVFKAYEIAAEIVKRCTGEATFDAIVQDLATTFKAPPERVRTDVAALLRRLADKKLLEL
jgi:pyrroloquinoline quinone biosynthesis protein D